MSLYISYIVSIVCAVIAGFTSYTVARRQAKTDLQKIQKQFEVDIEKEREKFLMEKERLEIEHKHQLELQQKDFENKMNSSLTTVLLEEIVKSPEVKKMVSQQMGKNTKAK